MRAESQAHGLISYELDEFLKEYGHPAGMTFRIEVTQDGTTYVYDDIVGEIHGDKVLMNLVSEKLVLRRLLN